MKNILEEFKSFAIKGNAVDLAVGVVIGASFGQIVTSLVNDIIMPPLGLLLGGVDFADKTFVLKESVGNAPAILLNYGLFINTIINFIIVAWVIFIVIRMLNKVKREEMESPSKQIEQSEEVILLREIRDSLRVR